MRPVASGVELGYLRWAGWLGLFAAGGVEGCSRQVEVGPVGRAVGGWSWGWEWGVLAAGGVGLVVGGGGFG